MNLRGQDPIRGSAGYAMAALLVSLGVMSVMMTMALPVWRQAAQREKEAELVFRGEQYARAIGLFQRKFAGSFPPSIDLLVEQRFLRKEYKDPMVEDGEFQVLYQTSAAPGAPGQSPQQPSPTTSGTGVTFGPRGGVVGVTSKSKETSLRLYNGRSKYAEWQFVYIPVNQQPGAPGAPGLRPGQPGAPGSGPQQPAFRLNPPGSDPQQPPFRLNPQGSPSPPPGGGGFGPPRQP